MQPQITSKALSFSFTKSSGDVFYIITSRKTNCNLDGRITHERGNSFICHTILLGNHKQGTKSRITTTTTDNDRLDASTDMDYMQAWHIIHVKHPYSLPVYIPYMVSLCYLKILSLLGVFWFLKMLCLLDVLYLLAVL